MMYKFTSRAQKALEIANNIAQELGHSYIGTEHILYGLTEEGAGVAARVLENQGINSEDVKSKIEELIGVEEPTEETLGFTQEQKE